MAWVVFLRAVNVGGANRCQPARIAKQLAKFGVVNIGAVGTFVIREDVSESTLRAAIARQLPFKCEIMICPPKQNCRSNATRSILTTTVRSEYHAIRERLAQTIAQTHCFRLTSNLKRPYCLLFPSVCRQTTTGC